MKKSLSNSVKKKGGQGNLPSLFPALGSAFWKELADGSFKTPQEVGAIAPVEDGLVALWARPTFEGDWNFTSELERELKYLKIPTLARQENVFFVTAQNFAKIPRKPIWAQDIWHSGHLVKIPSIKKAAAYLKQWGPHWLHLKEAHLPMIQNPKRGELIAEELRSLAPKRLQFGAQARDKKYGVFGLIHPSVMIVFPQVEAPWPLASHEFEEDKTNPPSRAYLKLWEALTVYAPDLLKELTEQGPKLNCFDMGATPGGWTWVLANLGVEVHAFDRAPLDPRLLKKKNVHFHQQSAFAVEPKETREVPRQFLFCSDIICYPEKLWELVEKWHNAGVENFICTIKFQGETDYAMVEKFLNMPNSKIIHLYHNKHEVTFFKFSPNLDQKKF